MFETAKRAGLQPNDFAKVLKVSRVTASLWLNGHNQPHRLIRPKVDKLLDAITSAVENGDFPVPKDMSRTERAGYIHGVLARHLAGKKSSDAEG